MVTFLQVAAGAYLVLIAIIAAVMFLVLPAGDLLNRTLAVGVAVTAALPAIALFAFAQLVDNSRRTVIELRTLRDLLTPKTPEAEFLREARDRKMQSGTYRGIPWRRFADSRVEVLSEGNLAIYADFREFTEAFND
jgi:hypothetical protein